MSTSVNDVLEKYVTDLASKYEDDINANEVCLEIENYKQNKQISNWSFVRNGEILLYYPLSMGMQKKLTMLLVKYRKVK